MPQAGSGTAFFSSWARVLAGTASVWAARFPGHETRLDEQPLTSIDAMADSLAESVAAIDAKHLTLFGHCSGAFIAYELAHRLRTSRPGSGRSQLIVSAQTPPTEDEASLAARPGRDISVRGIVGYLRELGGTPPQILDDPSVMAQLAPGIRADLIAVDTYVHPTGRTKLDQKIIAIAGLHDPLTSAGDLNAWRGFTTGPFHSKLFDAGRTYLTDLRQPVLDFLAETIVSLDAAQ